MTWFTLSQIAGAFQFAIRITHRHRNQIVRFGALNLGPFRNGLGRPIFKDMPSQGTQSNDTTWGQKKTSLSGLRELFPPPSIFHPLNGALKRRICLVFTNDLRITSRMIFFLK